MSKQPARPNLTGTPPRVGVFYPLMAVISLVGLGDSLYLSIKHFRHEVVPCTVTGGCEEVLNSAYATVGPIPLAALGAAAYFGVFSLALLVCFGYPRLRTHLLMLVVLMSLMTGYLLYLQAFTIQHFCQFCLLSAAVTISLLLLVIGARIASKSG
jgi:uncharacterized membrane protein